MARERGYALEQLASLTNLPTLPSVLYEILAALQDPNVDFDSLKKIVYRDPALVSRILRIANSSYFGRRHPTSSLETAFFTLGLNEVIAIVSSVGVVNAFAHIGSRSFDRRVLWRHSLMTGLTSRLLSRKLDLQQQTLGEEFIAGLLHDLGHIIILEYFPEEFGTIIDGINEGSNPSELERMILGNDHSEISGYIAERWRFSPSLAEALRWHHLPEKSTICPPLTRVVHFADRMCSWREMDERKITPSTPMERPEVLKIIFPDATDSGLQGFAEQLGNLPDEFHKLEVLSEDML